MTLAQSIDTVRSILGHGCTPDTRRRYEIEHTALMDVYEANPYNDQRWNITEAYIYREAYIRGAEQLRIEGRGELTTTKEDL